MANRKKHASDGEENPISLIEGWTIFFTVIGIIPWTIFCINTVLPAIGISSIPMGFAIILAIGPPILLWRTIVWISELKSDS